MHRFSQIEAAQCLCLDACVYGACFLPCQCAELYRNEEARCLARLPDLRRGAHRSVSMHAGAIARLSGTVMSEC